ncbi:MAG: Sua5/YciO/YrdC/YwlC family protein, partial [Methylocella sp.]
RSQFPALENLLTAETLRIDPEEPEPLLVGHVVRSLAAGNVVALPTDTFYGLAVDPVNLRAVERIYVCCFAPRTAVCSKADHSSISFVRFQGPIGQKCFT